MRQLSSLWIEEQLALEVLLFLWTPCPERKPQEVIRPPSFDVLLIQKVEQQILVSLDQPLRVNLSVLQLLVSVSLDSLQQSG